MIWALWAVRLAGLSRKAWLAASIAPGQSLS